VLTDVTNAYESLHTNDQIVQLYQSGYLKQAEDSRDISQYAYQRGAASLLDYLDEFRVKNADLPPEERISAYNRNMREAGWISTNLVDMADRFKSRWLIADYEAGDMVIHSPYMTMPPPRTVIP